MHLLVTRTIVILIAVMLVICILVYALLVKKKIILFSSSRFQESGVNNNNNNAFETQLQHLFNMHDCGIDHDIIDALPVFCYEELMGLKEPFDCAVCLCEFTLKDSLRLLPLCSHAFHIYCIDTWLLSNSTCPLCRGSLFGPGFEFDDSRDGNDVVDGQGYFGHFGQFERCEGSVGSEKRVFPVRVGSFRAANVGKGDEKEAGETSNGNFDDGQGHFGHFKHFDGSISNEKRVYTVRLGSFRATNVGNRGETEAGETSNSSFDDGDDRQGHSGHFKQPEDSIGNEKRVCDQGHFGHFKQPEDITGNEKRVCDQGHFGHFKQHEDIIGNEKRMYDQGHFGHFKQLERNIGNEKRVYQVKLGKFRATNVENEAGETSNSNVDARRCYSMGTYEYVVGNSELRVEYVPSNKSNRGSFGNKDEVDSSMNEGNNGKKISSKSKGESFSVSKIWLWSKKDHQKSQLFSGAHMVSSSVNIHS